jgi:hypothetical protein
MRDGVFLSNKEFNSIVELVSFTKYMTFFSPNGSNEISHFKDIPIELLDVFRMKFGSKYRIRYRGGRVGKHDGRTKTQCYQDCTKVNADRFAAYTL